MKNVFEAQNHLMSALLGEEKEYFTAVDGVEMTPSLTRIQVNGSATAGVR